ncbi:hypothetical protein JW711_04905, partial [Candidatus Woesearchaeota archaeon]|nr:hypothetical protein [Candidatus Woesearchaeota archaeon]
LDFQRLGYQTKVLLSLGVARHKREALKSHLMSHPNVNNLFSVDVSNGLLAEVVFENHAKLQQFIDALDSAFNLTELRTFNISQELKREEFEPSMDHMIIR